MLPKERFKRLPCVYNSIVNTIYGWRVYYRKRIELFVLGSDAITDYLDCHLFSYANLLN